MRLDAVTQFPALPNFAQALVALRMAHRAALAKCPAGDPERDLVDAAIAAATECVRDGQRHARHVDLFKRVMALRDLVDEHRAAREWVRAGLWWAMDALHGADMANDFPVDASVTRSARGAIAALGEDRELSRMQITILLASDIDQLLFACAEDDRLPSARLASRYEGLGPHVLARLAPVHPLSVTPYEPSGEEAAR